MISSIPPLAQTASADPLASPPVPHLDAAELLALAQVLRSAGYDRAQDQTRPEGPAPLEESPEGLTVLRKLFWRWMPVSVQEAASALAPVSVDRLVEAGLLERQADGVRALFQVQVYDGLFFIVDYAGRHQPSDLVLPIGPSGIYLAIFTIRRPVDSALDLGCGCGIQALLAARHAAHVTATDINPRALELTRLNAALNGATRIETLAGSYFEPVAGRKFDLIVANLPYVITPESRLIYRDLGATNDLPIRRNVEQVAEYLNEGGYGHVMLNWIHGAQQAWYEPVSAWTSHRNVDAWLIYSRSKTSEEYTTQWMTIKEKDDPEAYARVRAQWLNWYKAQGIERLAFGVLSLRRRTATNNWRCSLHAEQTAVEPLGEHVERLFADQDYLMGVRRPLDLLDRRLKPYAMTIERSKKGKYVARTTRAFLVRSQIDRLTARAIPLMDGTRDLRACILTALGWIPWGRTQALERVAGEIHQLMNLGMIVAAE